MIVGIDIDGVIARNPWKNWRRLFSKKSIQNRTIRLLLALLYYVFRRPRPEAKQWIKEQQTAGNKVLLISGIYGIAGYFVLGWLKIWQFPFDGLHLRRDWHVSQPEYKAKMVHKTGCELFIDDRTDVIAAITKRYLNNGFSDVRIFRNGLGYVVSRCNKTEGVVI